VRLIFVADAMPRALRRVIEFLNERMSLTEVLGIEIRQYVGDGGLKTLVPRLVGQAEQARIQKFGSARAASSDVEWDYYEQARPAQQLAIVREIYKRMESAISERKRSQISPRGSNLPATTSPRPGQCRTRPSRRREKPTHGDSSSKHSPRARRDQQSDRDGAIHRTIAWAEAMRTKPAAPSGW
jgi:hypothetical protein